MSSWETIDWKPADGQSLGAGASVLPLWPMLRSAIAEEISADAMCPITVGELLVGRITPDKLPTPLEAAPSFELLGTDRRGAWAALDPAKGDKIGGKAYTPIALQQLAMQAMDSAFTSLLGEGLGLGKPVAVPGPGTPLLLLRVPMASLDSEELVLIAAFDEAVAAELAAHIVALQALASEAPQPGSGPVAAAPQAREFKAKTPPAAAAPAAAAAPSGNGGGAPAPMPSNVRPAALPEMAAAPLGGQAYNIDLLLGVSLQVAVEIGRTTLPIRDVLALIPGSIVELDKLAGEKVDVLVNGRSIAQGEVVVVDENFGVRITDVVSRHQRLSPSASR